MTISPDKMCIYRHYLDKYRWHYRRKMLMTNKDQLYLRQNWMTWLYFKLTYHCFNHINIYFFFYCHQTLSKHWSIIRTLSLSLTSFTHQLCTRSDSAIHRMSLKVDDLREQVLSGKYTGILQYRWHCFFNFSSTDCV